MHCEYEMTIRWQNAVVTVPTRTLTLTLTKLSRIKRVVSARWSFRKIHFQNSSMQKQILEEMETPYMLLGELTLSPYPCTAINALHKF